jgi:hypothetical protein
VLDLTFIVVEVVSFTDRDFVIDLVLDTLDRFLNVFPGLWAGFLDEVLHLNIRDGILTTEDNISQTRIAPSVTKHMAELSGCLARCVTI